MVRFLFWNVCGVASPAERKGSGVRPLFPNDRRYVRLQRLIKVIAAREKADVVVLAESPFEGQLGIPIFVEARHTLSPNAATRTRLEIYHRGTLGVAVTQVVDRAVLLEISGSATCVPLLLACAHLASPLTPDAKERERRVEYFAADICAAEDRVGHQNTVLVGDLNYDPFDPPVTDAHGLNAVPSKEVARRLLRTANKRQFRYFYNPMWAHLTDLIGTVPGSYFRDGKYASNRFWYLPDQVMIRPALLRNWEDDKLRILTAVGTIRLLNRKDQPEKTKASDHLPLIFEIDV